MPFFNATLIIPLLSMVFSMMPHHSEPANLTKEYPMEQIGESGSLVTYDDILADWIADGSAQDHDQTWHLGTEHIYSSSNVSLIDNDYGYDAWLGENIDFVTAFTQSQGTISYQIATVYDILVTLTLDLYVLDTGVRDLEMAVLVNGLYQYSEAQQVTYSKEWVTPHEFEEDRYQNQIMPKATLAPTWLRRQTYDAQRLQTHPLLFRLTPGLNTITLQQLQGAYLLGNVHINALESLPSYNTYLSNTGQAPMMQDTLITYQAEHLASRNSLSTRFTTNREPLVTPFALIEGKLNVIDGATYQNGGQRVTYLIEAPASGYYHLTWKVLQNRTQTISYRRLLIDGEVPFAEAETIAFSANRKWQHQAIGPLEGDPYRFYLSQGFHMVSLEVNTSQTRVAHQTMRALMSDLNELSLSIKKITGNTIDPNREWDLKTYLPTIESDLDEAIAKVDAIKTTWVTLMKATQQSDVIASLNIARRLLVTLRDEIDLIPRRLNTLSGASGSVLYRLGIVLPLLIQSPLTIDQFYLHGETATLPKTQAGFFQTIWTGIRRFFASFLSDQFKETTDPSELVIWVSRSRQYVNLLQQMVDAEFTPMTGIPVRVSINPNEDKLILASSAGKQPDIAMGVAGWRPYDFAIRNSAYDLATFTDFREVSERFYPGSFLQLIYQNGVYALPETQNFYLLFYRTDIMNRLDLDIPDTWQDVIDILPELQRFGMNFYSMLSSANAFKAFVLTMPFIRQYGGKIFSDDGLRAAYDDPKTIEALTLMTDLYTTYSLPIEVGSFYNEFRYGRLPIGIGDFGMYISLLHAAPEIAGLWNIAPLPGVERDGVINRSFDGSSTSAMMFKETKKPQQAWTFLKWWTNAQTQLDYAENLISAYGPEYLWNTSNREAFANMSWDEGHRSVMLEQWEWIDDTAKTPASYMVERELSNIWNKVVYQGVNLRTAIEDSLIIADKEIRRKMIEFGFIDAQGNALKAYILPTRENIDDWIGLPA